MTRQVLDNIKIFMEAMASRGAINIAEYETVGKLYSDLITIYNQFEDSETASDPAAEDSENTEEQ